LKNNLNVNNQQVRYFAIVDFSLDNNHAKARKALREFVFIYLSERVNYLGF